MRRLCRQTVAAPAHGVVLAHVKGILAVEREHTFDELLALATTGRLRRRDVLRRAMALGLAAPAIAALLAACGDDDDDDDTSGDDDSAGGDATEADTSPTATEGEDDDSAGETPEDDASEGDASPTEAEEEDGDEGGAEEGEPVRGGRLLVALIGEPPSLDIHQTTATIVALTTWHMYETLFTWDANFQVVPLLAESHEVSDDGLLHTVTLRQGVLFHNGEELTAHDVVASIRRWGEISGLGKTLLEATDDIVEVDDYTIEFHLNQPLGSFEVLLARQNQGAAIYPASIVENAGPEPLEEFIGTGPYMFVERQADAYIRMARFEDYVGLEGEPNGYAGGKAAYIDEIEFIPVPDEAARIAGLQAGEYHYLESIIPDQYHTLKDDPNIVAEIMPPDGWDVMVLNTTSPLMSNQTIRQAFLAAINCEEVALAANGEGFYRLDPGFMLQETVWHSTVSEELYNQGNPERCKELLDEAGYDGTPLRFMTTQEYLDQYNMAVVARQQLEAGGFVIEELEIFDWATVNERRTDPELWDVFTTGFSFRVDPIQMPPLSGCNWPGWWCSDAKVAAAETLQSSSDFDERYAATEEIQRLWYEEVPGVKVCDTSGVSARLPSLKNFKVTHTQLQPEFVNMWLDES